MAEGRLYIVATPIGNLEDMTARASRVLREVDLIAAEDTRHSRKLLDHLGVTTSMVPYHEHNERQATPRLLEKLLGGVNIALISDAGTPLLSDPGYLLVTAARERALEVIPIPGPSAITAALSVAGLPVHRFLFEGFLPADRGGRVARLREVAREKRTIVYYEAPHRILKALRDMQEVFGGDRVATLARELTKRYEEVRRDSVATLIQLFEEEKLAPRGEFVILVAGMADGARQSDQAEAGSEGGVPSEEEQRLLGLLLPELPPRKATDIVARFTGGKRKSLYQWAVSMRNLE